MSHDTVISLYEDQAGILWIGTEGGGLNRFDRETESFTTYQHDEDDSDSLSDDEVWTIYEDREGTLWIGTSDGLNIFERETEKFLRYEADPDDPKVMSQLNVINPCRRWRMRQERSRVIASDRPRPYEAMLTSFPATRPLCNAKGSATEYGIGCSSFISATSTRTASAERFGCRA